MIYKRFIHLYAVYEKGCTTSFMFHLAFEENAISLNKMKRAARVKQTIHYFCWMHLG